MAYFEDISDSPQRGKLVDGNGNLLSVEPTGVQMDVPYEDTFASIIMGASRSFMRGLWDEALFNNRFNALAMRRDARILGWLFERYEGTMSRKWSLEIPDESDPVQVAVRDGMTQAISQIPYFKRIIRYLLESRWYGRSAAQLLWHEVDMDLPAVPMPALFPFGNDREAILKRHLAVGGQLEEGKDGKPQPKKQTERRKVTTVRAARPVNGDKINFTFDGVPLIAIYAGLEGNLRKYGADVRPAKDLKTVITWDNMSPVLVLDKQWRERFLIAIHNPDDADYYEAERAGAAFGVGIRSRIYWVNHIRQDLFSFVHDFLDRVGIGLIMVKFEAGNVKAQQQAEEVCKKWNRRSTLAVPVSPDQLRSGGGIEILDVPTAGALVMQELIDKLDKQIERFILGQSMSSGESGREGMGGTAGPAEMAQTTKHQKLLGDAEEIEECITGSVDEPGICSVMQRWTYPGTIDKFRVKFKFQMEDPSAVIEHKIDAIVSLAAAGVEFDMDEARKLTGQPKPAPGAATFGGKPEPAPGLPGAAPGAKPGAVPGVGPEPDQDGAGNGKPAAGPGLNGKGAAP